MLSKNIAKYIQSSGHKKFRDQHNIFIAEGPKVVGELLASKKFICNIVCGVDAWMAEPESRLIKTPVKNAITITEAELQKISLLKTPNKVVAVFEKSEAHIINLQNRLTLMLDEIQDPGNLGTMIRIADWFGVETIICSNNSVDCYNPKVVQSAMGSLARVNIHYTRLESLIKENAEISVYASTLHGKNVATINKITEGIIIIGNESKGIRGELLQLADEKITIPGRSKAESLNAAVAAGIILSHIT